MKKYYTVILVFLFFANSYAQTVWENHRSEVYPYLYRLSQKGLIDFQDIIRPVSREQIAGLLMQLDSSRTKLTSVETKEYKKTKINDYVVYFIMVIIFNSMPIHLEVLCG
jgi:hypothetical protein